MVVMKIYIKKSCLLTWFIMYKRHNNVQCTLHAMRHMEGTDIYVKFFFFFDVLLTVHCSNDQFLFQLMHHLSALVGTKTDQRK